MNIPIRRSESCRVIAIEWKDGATAMAIIRGFMPGLS